VIERLNKEVRATLNVAEVQKKFVESAGAEAVGMTPAEFLARIKSDAIRYKRVVDKAGIRPG
jgi:tripartite-type tricarboxylate transporter receptor subunit TctC